MKTFYTLILCSLAGMAVNAQFLTDSMQTFAICDAAGTQANVKSFSDGQDGYNVFWIDKRNGNSGSMLMMQRLDSSGVPLGSINGDAIVNTTGKEIWGYVVQPWQSGYLLAWVQGSFGIGGDSIFCDYIDISGNHFWPEATTVSYKGSPIIYLSEIGLQIIPADSGATITYSVTYTGGSSGFSFNRIDFNGNLYWPVNNFGITMSGYISVVTSDNHNGFYTASSSGGIGAPITVNHFRWDGTQYYPSALNVTASSAGRNNGWNLLCDADTNAYVIWDSNTGDILIAKITPDGQFAWLSDYRSICSLVEYQTNCFAVLNGNRIYVTWADSRIPASNYFIYSALLDTDGNNLWSQNGISVSRLNSYLPYPKLAVRTDGSVVNAFNTGGKLRAQSILSDSSMEWQLDGQAVSTIAPYYNDLTALADNSGTCAFFWSDGTDIYGARLSRNGILTNVNQSRKHTFSVYPNPAKSTVYITAKTKSASTHFVLYNLQGQKISESEVEFSGPGESLGIPLNDVSPGMYFLKIISENANESIRIIVE